jgi:hypothetical protein
MKRLLFAAAMSLAVIPIAAVGSTAVAKTEAQKPRFSAKSKLGELMDNPATMEILMRHIPDVMKDPDIGKGRGYSLRFIAGFDKRIKVALSAIERDLATIP